MLHQCRVLLGHAVHLGDGVIDAFNAGRLLDGGSGDVTHDVRHVLDAGHHLCHRDAGLMDQCATGIHF